MAFLCPLFYYHHKMVDNYFLKHAKYMKYLSGFVLYLFAIIVFMPLAIINAIVAIIKGARKNLFFETINNYFKDEALAIDIFANTSLKILWDTTLRIKGGYPFGNHQDETISSALGKNQRDNTLSFLGKIICFLLDLIEKDHCLSSIDSHLTRRKK